MGWNNLNWKRKLFSKYLLWLSYSTTERCFQLKQFAGSLVQMARRTSQQMVWKTCWVCVPTVVLSGCKVSTALTAWVSNEDDQRLLKGPLLVSWGHQFWTLNDRYYRTQWRIGYVPFSGRDSYIHILLSTNILPISLSLNITFFPSMTICSICIAR